MCANSNTQNRFHKAYFALSETVIAQGFFDPDIDWNGFRVPLFPLEECERIIRILATLDSPEYTFIRNEDDTGYILTDTDKTRTDSIEKLDSTLMFDGVEVRVNGLADGWCWEDISEDSYREWNKLIRQEDVRTTVEELRKE